MSRVVVLITAGLLACSGAPPPPPPSDADPAPDSAPAPPDATPAAVLPAAEVLLDSRGDITALAHDGGEGWWGETDDKVVTNAGFILIAFFPLFIFTMSMIQWRLEKRKDARKAAAKARTARKGWSWS